METAPASRHALRGFAFILLAVVFWGGSASLAKYLFTGGRFDPLIISQTRTSFSFVLFAVAFSLFKRDVFRVRMRDLPAFALLGIIGVAVTNYSYYFTVQHSTVATAILIQYTAPALVMVYIVAVRKSERANMVKLAALVLALFGCFLAVTGGNVQTLSVSPKALVSGSVSALCYAYMLVKTKDVLRRYDVWTMLTYAFGFSLLFWLMINPPQAIAAQEFTVKEWGVLLLFAVVSILIPNTLFSMSMRSLEATTVGIASTAEPIVAIIIAYLTLGESLSAVQSLGALIVVASLIMLQSSMKLPAVEP